jgi:hypothetical protein
MNWPLTTPERAAEKVAMPVPSVVTVMKPRKNWPWPNPDGSQELLAKNSIVYVVLGAAVSVPWTEVVPLVAGPRHVAPDRVEDRAVAHFNPIGPVSKGNLAGHVRADEVPLHQCLEGALINVDAAS